MIRQPTRCLSAFYENIPTLTPINDDLLSMHNKFGLRTEKYNKHVNVNSSISRKARALALPKAGKKSTKRETKIFFLLRCTFGAK